MIYAGNEAQIEWGSGSWIFLDVGFSSKGRTCGFLVGERNPLCVTFGDAKEAIRNEVAKSISLNLVIEAPLSVCFDSSGNPTGRRMEIEGTQARYWYTGPGCAVMVAAMYLLQDLERTEENASIRLFEGFVSYKSHAHSSHGDDVLALRKVVHDPSQGSIYGHIDQIRRNPTDKLLSAFAVAGQDYGIPPIIKPKQTPT